MASDWRDRWEPTGREFSGGQGLSFEVMELDGARRSGFVKTLRSRKSPRARARFRREVVAYETLTGPGLPQIYEHNADDWDKGTVPLFMVLEFVPGLTLSEYVDTRGALDLDKVTVLAKSLMATLATCHAQDILHRDIKPKNVVLRDEDPSRPLLVDFGLSFNKSDASSGITEVGEDIGNRFLRLPEQSSGARLVPSDITQAAGLIFYSLTSVEPRVLVDENAAMPHQRPDALRKLRQSVPDERERFRLLALFDKAFAGDARFRYQTAEQLVAALELVRSPSTYGDSFEALVARVDEVAQRPEVAENASRRSRIEAALQRATAVVRHFAEPRGLVVSQTGHQISPGSSPPRGSTRLALRDATEPGRLAETFASYDMHLQGPETIFVHDEVVYWRGIDVTEERFAEAVIRVAAAHYLQSREA